MLYLSHFKATYEQYNKQYNINPRHGSYLLLLFQLIAWMLFIYNYFPPSAPLWFSSKFPKMYILFESNALETASYKYTHIVNWSRQHCLLSYSRTSPGNNLFLLSIICISMLSPLHPKLLSSHPVKKLCKIIAAQM